MDEKKGSKCNQCGKTVVSGAYLGDESACDCKMSDSSSIRLGPVPDSAFRPPSPRPPSKAEHHDSSTHAAIAASGHSKYEIISVREKHGDFRKAIPCMPMAVAIICCLFNVLIPGTGTLFAGLTVICGCKTEHESRRTSLCYNFIACILQLALAPIIVGWVWSVLWGITFINVSATKELQDRDASEAV